MKYTASRYSPYWGHFNLLAPRAQTAVRNHSTGSSSRRWIPNLASAGALTRTASTGNQHIYVVARTRVVSNASNPLLATTARTTTTTASKKSSSFREAVQTVLAVTGGTGALLAGGALLPMIEVTEDGIVIETTEMPEITVECAKIYASVKALLALEKEYEVNGVSPMIDDFVEVLANQANNLAHDAGVTSELMHLAQNEIKLAQATKDLSREEAAILLRALQKRWEEADETNTESGQSMLSEVVQAVEEDVESEVEAEAVEVRPWSAYLPAMFAEGPEIAVVTEPEVQRTWAEYVKSLVVSSDAAETEPQEPEAQRTWGEYVHTFVIIANAEAEAVAA